MEDSYTINSYSAGSLIAISIGQLLTSIFDNSSGLIITLLGVAGLVIFSKPDKLFALSILVWAIGYLFIISHWMGGHWIILAGGILVLFSLYQRFKQDRFKNFKLWILISICVLFTSYYVRSQHYDGFKLDFYGFLLGALGLIISYGLRFLRKKPKKIEDGLKLALVISLTLKVVVSIGHYPGYNLFGIMLLLSMLSLGGYVLITEYLKNKKPGKQEV